MSKIKKRRSNGEGSIRQEPNGRWIGQIAVGFRENGKPDRRTKRADTKKEVIEWMAKLKHEILITGYKQRADTAQFDVLYKRWFNQHYAHAKNVYRKNLIERSNRLLDYFGDVEVQKITKELAQEYFNKELERCTRNTVKKLQNLMDGFFNFCQEDSHIIKHPTKSIVLKGGNYARNQTKNRKALTDDEMARVDEVLENADLRDRVLITLLFHTGMRPGEVPAISWVDIQDGMLLITKAVKKQVEYESDGWTEKQAYSAVGLPKGSRDGEVKTRAIPISEKLETVLAEWKEHQSGQPNPHNLIFPTKDGNIYAYSGLRSLWERTLKKHGLDDLGRCLYATRHTFATRLHESNVPMSYISSAMGHNKMSTTQNIYIDKPDIGAVKATIRDGLKDAYATKAG